MPPPPADNSESFGEIPLAALDDSQKLDLILQQVQWLTATVSGLLEQFQRNPMTRMMMGRNTR